MYFSNWKLQYAPAYSIELQMGRKEVATIEVLEFWEQKWDKQG